MIRQALLFSVALSLCAPIAMAQDATPQTCAPSETIDKYRLLRQLSLDLRGRIPTIEEYEALSGLTSVTPDMLQEMLASDEYFGVVREYHRKLMWSTVASLRVVDATRSLRKDTTGTQPIYYLATMTALYRGAIRTPCLDRRQPASAYTGGVPNPLQGQREGWVEVNPYWDPSSTIRVCAYDAQTRATYNGKRCQDGFREKGCGCGPGLRWCADGIANRDIRKAIAEEPGRIFEHIVREGRPYFEALRTRETLVNGPLNHYYRYLSSAPNDVNRTTVAVDARMGAMDVGPGYGNAAAWRVTRRQGVHAGVLTTAAYTLRFASNRSRANRFRTAFRCEPFLPSAEGLPADAADESEPNLRRRSGCAHCHQSLDVLAAHWGKFRSDGQWGFLNANPLQRNSTCMACGGSGNPACSDFCNTYFVTRENSHPSTYTTFRGLPMSRAYLNVAEAEVFNAGPRALSDDDEEKRAIASCAVRRLTEHLLGREVTDDEQTTLIPELEGAFASSGYQFAELTRAIVTSDKYRTVR